ncbi:hypothetical protein EVAR_23974_1 [Eumeta japonica]|uniref:Uncharacterized protein n=1 Tax=Eumeta variegata TaxID=151549 RepID=A0A4C1V2R9_EUMVA|nr:hypothetical protein EVAR_23974_1 [Eumeta japonica]
MKYRTHIIRNCSRRYGGSSGQAGDWRMRRARGIIKPSDNTSHSCKRLAANVNTGLGLTTAANAAPAPAS